MIDSKFPLNAAGGRHKVAETLNLTVSAVEKWPRAGYPEKFWAELVDMAVAAGAVIDVEDLHSINQEIRRRRTEIVSGAGTLGD